MFFELSTINVYIKKQVINIFHNCSCHLTDSFDAIMKASETYAKNHNTRPFKALVEGFGYKDPIMIMNLMRFVN